MGMENVLGIDLNTLTPIGRSAYLGLLTPTGRQVKIVLVKGAEVLPLQEAATLRRKLVEELTVTAGLPVPFADEIASVPCTFEGSDAWAFVNSYVPGADLTRIARSLAPGQDSGLADEIGQAVGVSLAAVHSASQPLAGALRHKEDAEVVDQDMTWREVTLTRQEGVARRVHEASKITALDDRQLRRAHSLAAAFTGRFRTTLHPTAGPAMACLIHKDLHGGNIILDTSAPPDTWIASFIDDQLSVGDSGYDIASIHTWAFEVMDRPSFMAFSHGLERGYKSLIPDCTLRSCDLLLYLADRSLGRLAYYARSAPKWIEPYGSERLIRHLDLLDCIASTAGSPDSIIDPFATVRRLAT
ncbi:aminoglycoside phosphotransferase family protein [Streptomyces sp. S.PB5]|uniref:aminoglycoside phosphotransferase family protein n=1 Tax=Streptomyces sp. S.PB5 TaxID=3020844 RepID=UPI0025B05A12|nr:aminoglycoside phosphotransferase family protein [Streptomyces sp. S.PB5]MDN3025648.1 aminoglycoside phosphotransferase family protein [Streptomyces sp. S.PB5]